jgi:hypothetical protein
MKLQEEFEAIVQAVDSVVVTQRQACVELEALFASLQGQAFGGGL